MKNIFIDKFVQNRKNQKWITILAVSGISWILTVINIYYFRDYGIALFILLPVFIGFSSTVLYGLKNNITKKEAFYVGLWTLLFYTLGLLIFAIEGLICIIMVAPIGLLLVWIGTLIGYQILRKQSDKSIVILLIFINTIPLTAFVEKDIQPTLTSVVTSVEVKASPEVIWKNVVEFSNLNKPNEFIFKTGIAYPINAQIKGSGVGAVRYCNFTTGSFVEPITTWDEPKLLGFNVLEQPAPMRELNFWDIDAPHLHDYFVSKKGQFKLTQLPNGNTLLEGTTWYYHDIKPEIYWKLWSDFIIHKIHDRVLNHIKEVSEK